ncbi:hypothetical protein HQ585_16170 [candidate division KSB1 bacterium]|nr:hypothetical protein [candidate division KSB1 bacterium]
MKRISREEAETMFQKSNVVSSKIEKDRHGLRVLLKLENKIGCIVKYDADAQTKSYFVTCGC